VQRLRLWSDEVEALRAEARAAVEAGRAMFPWDESARAEMSRDERVAQHRAELTSVTFESDAAEARDIAGVPCRVFRPARDPRAVYLHFHGGAMIAGSATLMDIPNQELARELDVAVVSVDYRKAPEHPWPAGPDDGFAVARWLVENAQTEFGCDSVLIGGESSGGYMTAITALRVRDKLQAIDRVKGLNLTYGVFDWGRSPSQRGARPSDGFDVLTDDETIFVADCFVPGMTDEERRSPEVSPAYADLRGLPPCFVSVGTCDHLLDDSLMFAARAAAAEVEVDLFVAPDLPHAFQAFDCGITKLWGERLNEWFRAHVPD
jgi:acetyl esterase/lipase